MTTDTRQKIEANKEAYRKAQTRQVVFPRTEAECETEEDKKCLKVAQAALEFIKKLDNAYKVSENSTLFFGPGSFPRDSKVGRRIARNAGKRNSSVRNERE